ncbi:hypothetical protein DQW77_10215 [Roseovarius sp. TE539]|uniref:carboxyl transferase domain-containing protein n=1 Tax=Roseovarius sp. TE539 TaxID=2249812 RepID=UPI000DE1A0BA|nr:carboxyl transferase domain-containing protein [Roseovarius sp. TE539]RBI72710.1 hypothetical protein DQW77_10215 [Roseovarius sp. TE539]
MALSNREGTLIVFPQNITGYMTGCRHESAGITKDGARMIMVKICSPVPGFATMRNGAFGAGIHGVCGRAFDGRFVVPLPNSQIGLMAGEPAANTKADVNAAQTRRNGKALNAAVQKDPHETTGKARMEQLSTCYAAPDTRDAGIGDPAYTRNALGRAITGALTPPLGVPGHGALRQ